MQVFYTGSNPVRDSDFFNIATQDSYNTLTNQVVVMDAVILNEFEKEMLLRKCELELEEVDKRRSDLIGLINKLKNSTPKKPSITSDKKFTWKSISLQILKEMDDFMMTDDIYNEVIKRHPDLASESRRTIVASLSGSLSQLATSGRLSKVENPLGLGNYWGLSDWFDGKTPIHPYSQKLIDKGLRIQEDSWS